MKIRTVRAPALALASALAIATAAHAGLITTLDGNGATGVLMATGALARVHPEKCVTVFG